MSKRNQLRAAKGMLALATAGTFVEGVRGVFGDMDLPSMQNSFLLVGPEGNQMTVAEVKAMFPDYKTNHDVIKNMIGAYAGRLIHHALAQVGLHPGELSGDELAALLVITTAAEEKAFVRMTAN
ncbi:hypothetical protein D3C75_527230 [compost metagenome]